MKEFILSLIAKGCKIIYLNGFKENINYLLNSVDLDNINYEGSEDIKSYDGYKIITAHFFTI